MVILQHLLHVDTKSFVCLLTVLAVRFILLGNLFRRGISGKELRIDLADTFEACKALISDHQDTT